MADSFFGFDTTLTGSGLEDAIDGPPEEEDLGEEEEYDALNDETFGSDAAIGDWEQDHEKLAQLTESKRHHQNLPLNKNGVDVDIEESLSHLVLDEKDGTTPRPGVWDSPSSLPLSQSQPPRPLSTALKNARTVEELERGLMANRPPPGLSKLPHHPSQQQSGGPFLFDPLPLNEQLQINGIPPPRFPPGLGLPGPHPVVIPPNVRLPHPQFMQNPRLISNQGANMLRFHMPPHLMMQHGNQRQPHHGSFNFPQPPHPNMGPPPFLRPEHPMMTPFSNNQMNHQQHSGPHSGNQRNQNNRSFHSNEQQGNPQPFFKNNQYPHQNQRNNQRYHHHQHHLQGMNGIGGSGEYDEYAGLMSSREKQWLINIQLLQLNTNQPYIDDYYYTVFCDRQNKQNENQDQKDRKHHNNNGYHRDSRDREQPQHVLTKVVYTPTQFENSLGKLQCGSVTAPRKIIDMDVVPNNDPQQVPPPQQKDTKKTRQLLLEIERLYTLQLKLEDMSNPLALLAEQQQQQQQQPEGETEVKPPKKTKPELISTLLASLLQLLRDDKLASMLSIRKGKTLLLRFLPYLSVTESSNQLSELWSTILRGLAVIGRRDAHLLSNFYPEFRRWIQTITDFSVLQRLARGLTESVNQPTKNNSLAFALTNKFGVSVIASVLEQAEALFPVEDSVACEWSTFVVSIVERIGATPPSVAPCHPIAANTLNQHLNRIRSLKMERYAPLELLLTDANPLR
ncbi:protein PAT1 homolog 1 isoform X2 [Cephus cinctus]|uniref:Protein PAT1 homolog 1 isoform X2 n=1 Tax=Cephus cinctus TaxID=211228 RepID=A0AAJ7BIY3_CEPCN|nr:protein PAT1 homolog 1 isoform X2 [Cephus cinctus]